MVRFPVFVLTFCFVGLFFGCRSRQPLVVRVFRDSRSPLGREIDRRFYELRARNLSLSSGRRIVIATMKSQDYKATLRDQVGSELRPEIVVLNSPTDATISPIIKRESDRAVNICGAARACPSVVPAFIPSWVTDPEEVEGSQIILKALWSMPPNDRLGAAP
jgi:hypothetical protein